MEQSDWSVRKFFFFLNLVMCLFTYKTVSQAIPLYTVPQTIPQAILL